jgi:hypothetical protein
MTRLLRPIAATLVCIALASCVAYPYPYEPQTVMVPASFDRSWDAALGAAADAGVQVTSADRSTGRITGTKAGAAVTIQVEQQAGGNIRVGFSAPDARETNPTLNERWLASYNRRMGR